VDGIPVTFLNGEKISFTVYASVKEIIIWKKNNYQATSNSNNRSVIKSL